MNIFVLSSGRCGTTTFSKACNYIENYSVQHESRSHLIGNEHFSYPDNHIEIDNRLSWFLGWLDELYGNNAFYVHLKRDKKKVAESYLKRWDWDISIIRAYEKYILPRSSFKKNERLKVCLDLCNTIEKNINLFLKDKSKKMVFNIENYQNDFIEFWKNIEAKGNLSSAIKEFNTNYNASISSNMLISQIKRLIK